MNVSNKLEAMEPNGRDAEALSDTGDILTAEEKPWDRLPWEEPVWEDEPLAEAACDARACDLRVRSRSRRLRSLLKFIC